MQENPFTPSFGTVPYVMAGRDSIIGDMRSAFGRTNRDPALSTLLVGARGTGKTALLACIREEAQSEGWVAVGATALPGLLEDIVEQAQLACENLVEQDERRRLSSVGVGPLGMGWDTEPAAKGNWRTQMTRLLEQLAVYDTGLLITVDEVKADLDEMVQLAAVYQMFVSERRRVSLVMAGLPYHAHRLVTHKSVSFLRRATMQTLGPVPDADVAVALRQTFESGGKDIADDALAMCVDAIGGFPYLLQLVGYRTWAASGNENVASVEHAKRGIALARQEMEDRILAATYYELSAGDIRYLQAMLADKRESRVSDVAKRMGVTSGYASKYKARLLAHGVVAEPARGWVAFEMPGFRKYLESRLEEDAGA